MFLSVNKMWKMNATSEQSQEDEPLCGYKFVGDNVDKNVKPSR